MKKLTALLLALVMVLAMNVSALAAANTQTSTKNSDKGIASTDNTIEIAKELVFKNADGGAVREPNINYIYTISSAEPNSATVTDAAGITATVKAGVIGAVSATTSTVAFSDETTQTASATGEAVTKYASFTFKPEEFKVDGKPTPGIYRYKIAETTSVKKNTVGIEQSIAFDANRYLDVYVRWSDAEHTTLAIYGYVLYKNATDGSKEVIKSGEDSIDDKSEGFVDTTEKVVDPTDPEGGLIEVKSGDVYETENLYIHKTTTGDLADKNNLFPITVNLTAPGSVKAGIKLDVSATGEGTVASTGSDDNGAYVTTWNAVTGSVKDGSVVIIKNVPKGATATVVEKNNTADSYKVKAGTTEGGAELLTEAIVNKGDDTVAFKTAVTLDAKKDIYFTNTLGTVSQTGVVLRFAPYAIMLGAGVALFIILKVRKNKAVEEA